MAQQRNPNPVAHGRQLTPLMTGAQSSKGIGAPGVPHHHAGPLDSALLYIAA